MSSDEPVVLVSILFNTHHRPQKSQVEGLAQAIVGFVKQKLPEMGGRHEEEYDWINREYFPEQISHMSVTRLPSITKTFFGSSGATWLATLSEQDLARVVPDKDKRYEDYRSRCDEVWLIIDTNTGDSMSTWFEIEPEKLTTPIDTRFERVFIVNRFGRELHEVKTTKTGTGASCEKTS
ncbi:hypothetical protein CBR71_06995 [Bordetella hinzii]|nr:hypothetical protein CBR71_06995 [Bordetella hinzii]